MRDALLATANEVLGPARAKMLGEFLRFGTVGTAGFLVDSGVLLLGLALGLGPWLGRVVSYLLAATTTYSLNRIWTFRAAGHGHSWRQWALFVTLSLIGFAINFGIYALLILRSPIVAAHPVLGVVAGTLGGMFINFFMSRRFVFGSRG